MIGARTAKLYRAGPSACGTARFMLVNGVQLESKARGHEGEATDYSARPTSITIGCGEAESEDLSFAREVADWLLQVTARFGEPVVLASAKFLGMLRRVEIEVMRTGVSDPGLRN